MSQNPTFFCARCHTTRPPLFAVHTYTCVMCGKQRTVAEYKREMEKLRSETPETYVGATPKLEVSHAAPNTARPATPRPTTPMPAPAAKATPQKPAAVAKAVPAPVAKAVPAPVAKAVPAPVAKASAKPKAPTKPKASAKPKAPTKPKVSVKVVASEDTLGCGWRECQNQARPRSKYCSRACSNKNARHRHAQRKTP